MVGAGTCLWKKEITSTFSLAKAAARQLTVMEELTPPFTVTEPTDRQGSVSATAPGCSSCSHCSVCLLDIPLVHSSRDLSVKQTKDIYISWRNQPRDAPGEQPEEANREVWKLTQERQDGKRAALVACGGRCHQRGAHFASSKYWHNPMAWMGSSLGPAHVLAGLRCPQTAVAFPLATALCRPGEEEAFVGFSTWGIAELPTVGHRCRPVAHILCN